MIKRLGVLTGGNYQIQMQESWQLMLVFLTILSKVR
ncbi:Uncharacterised protein [Bacteroides xylanisolvens]|nr:Uncharacterised protein [Bacteroides xylanisolvens]